MQNRMILNPQKEVSLFTREWIEIPLSPAPLSVLSVSLFTREWIEIAACPRLWF